MSYYGADRSLGYEQIQGGPKGTFMKLDWRILKKMQVCCRFYSSMKEDREDDNDGKLIKESHAEQF